MSSASEQHRIAVIGGLRDYPESEWDECKLLQSQNGTWRVLKCRSLPMHVWPPRMCVCIVEAKWTAKGVKFVREIIQSKGVTKEDIYGTLKQLEAEQGPFDGFGKVQTH